MKKYLVFLVLAFSLVAMAENGKQEVDCNHMVTTMDVNYCSDPVNKKRAHEIWEDFLIFMDKPPILSEPKID